MFTNRPSPDKAKLELNIHEIEDKLLDLEAELLFLLLLLYLILKKIMDQIPTPQGAQLTLSIPSMMEENI